MNLIKRLKKIVPEHIKPVANNCAGHLAAMEKLSQERIFCDEVKNKQNYLKSIVGKSGISPLHKHCYFDNFIASSSDQHAALGKAKEFAENFGQGFTGFIFSGGCGTGKNHLSSAICHFLMAKGKTVLCITIPELMMKLRAIYSKVSELSEENYVNTLCTIDFLVLDEIGIQHSNSENTEIIINHIVDRRTSHKKPLGMLTNLGYDDMIKALGMRVIDRMMMDKGLWINFNWESYRSKVEH